MSGGPILVGKICELKYGSSLTEQMRRPGSVPVYGSNGIVGYHDESLAKGPGIILGRKGSVGAVHFEQNAFFPIDTTYYIDELKLPADKRWLYYALLSLGLNGLKDQTGVPGLNRERVYLTPICFPEIEEQRQIAARLDAQMSALSDAQEAVEERIRALVSLPFAMIRESLKSPTSILPLRKALTEVKQGVGPCWQDFPVLGATRAGVAPAKDKVGKSPERYKLADPTTVFYNPMRIRLGSIALVDDDDPPGITSPDYVVVKGTAGVLDTRWFYYWFRSPAGEALVDSLSRGAVRERILYNRLAEGTIAAPSFEDQIKCSAQIKGVRAALESSLAQLPLIAAAGSALLREAFE